MVVKQPSGGAGGGCRDSVTPPVQRAKAKHLGWAQDGSEILLFLKRSSTTSNYNYTSLVNLLCLYQCTMHLMSL